jgi:hypothetical protein
MGRCSSLEARWLVTPRETNPVAGVFRNAENRVWRESVFCFGDRVEITCAGPGELLMVVQP